MIKSNHTSQFSSLILAAGHIIKKGPGPLCGARASMIMKEKECVRLLSILLVDLTIELHGVVHLEVADYGECCTVVVATSSTSIGSTAPRDIARGVTYYQPLLLVVHHIASGEESEEVAVEVRQGTAHNSHLVDANLYTTSTSYGVTLTGTIVLRCYLTCLVLEVDAIALQSSNTSASRCDFVLVLSVVNGNSADMVVVQRHDHTEVASTSGVLFTLISAFEN